MKTTFPRRLAPALIAALTWCFVLLVPGAEAATYYVDYETGDDGSSGLDRSFPWKHSPGMGGATGTAAATTLQSGDTVYFKKGVVWPASALPLYLRYGGSSGSPITYATTDWGTGNYATFDAQNAVIRCVTFYDWNGAQSYLVLAGLELKNPASDGGYRRAVELRFGSNKTITDSKLYSGGIWVVSCSSCVVKNNDIDFNNIEPAGERPAVEVSYSSSSGTTVQGNTIYGFNYAAIKTGGNATDRPNNVVVERNHIHSPGAPTTLQAGIIFRDTDSSMFRYNVIDLRSSSGQTSNTRGFTSWDAGGGNAIHNNSIVMNHYGIGVHTTAQNNNSVTNNIILDADVGIAVGTGTGTEADYNDIYGHNTLYSGSIAWGGNNITSDPLLVAVGNEPYPYFYPQSASPVRDTGDPATAPGIDFAGASVPQGGRADIGAFEYVASADTLAPAAPSNLTVQ
ncbi:MAG TPA: right-handed parallel beta-helix repeat-containing protein [Acidiferrobacterales bacterium]|nr:right-handed parallel beta-helix repeat-containing protein [Acidiferrobacterales bacterium]